MASTVVTIPQLTVTPGAPRTAGPVTIPTGLTFAKIAIDRNASGGLNSLTSASVLTLLIEISYDGGSTWGLLIQSTQEGGASTIGLTGPSTDIPDPTNPNRRARGTVTAVGPSGIGVSGNLTLS